MAKKNTREVAFEDKLPLAIQTGDVLFGFKECIKSLMNQRCKMVVVSANLPPLKRRMLEYYAYLNNNVPLYFFNGTNNDLARSCDKFYRIGVLSIIDDGEADLIPAEAA
ncbi:60S ribosomal protein L30 [Trachipleistophora hominis]|uniref:60S ribosomal protein L30 n=1 Tax=Trachipleistophora hominis TaxID=72359 RepID=L7K0B9_TRAHO|nr:60S ribosomal protein L30 [Trachipleistophora hominis]